jgi:hypothetical protein
MVQIIEIIAVFLNFGVVFSLGRLYESRQDHLIEFIIIFLMKSNTSNQKESLIHKLR